MLNSAQRKDLRKKHTLLFLIITGIKKAPPGNDGAKQTTCHFLQPKTKRMPPIGSIPIGFTVSVFNADIQ